MIGFKHFCKPVAIRLSKRIHRKTQSSIQPKNLFHVRETREDAFFVNTMPEISCLGVAIDCEAGSEIFLHLSFSVLQMASLISGIVGSS